MSDEDLDSLGPRIDKLEHKINDESSGGLLGRTARFLWDYKLYVGEFIAIFALLILLKPPFICEPQPEPSTKKNGYEWPPKSQTTERKISYYLLLKWQIILFATVWLITICTKYYYALKQGII